MAFTSRSIIANKVVFNILTATPAITLLGGGLQLAAQTTTVTLQKAGLTAIARTDSLSAMRVGLSALIQTHRTGVVGMGLQVLSLNNGFDYYQYNPAPDRPPSDLQQSAEITLLALVNADNASSLIYGDLTLGDVTFGIPSVADGFKPLNSVVSLEAKAGSKYNGAVSLNYDRIPLSDVTSSSTLTVSGTPSTTHDLLDPFNAAYGTSCTSDDWIDDTLPDLSSANAVPVTIAAAPTSLYFRGTVTLNITQESTA